MNRNEAFHLSRLIEQCSRALAEWTLERHQELQPGDDVATDHDRRTRGLVTRFRYLAQAIAVNEPGVFIESVQWARAAALARGEAVTEFDVSLSAMAEVVEAEFPGRVAAIAVPMIQSAKDSSAEPTESGVLSLDIAALEYLEALLEHDRPRATSVCMEALNNGHQIEDVYTAILQPAQIELGTMWHRGEISVAAEHAGTAITESVMAVLRDNIEIIEKNRVVVAVAVGGELHSVGVRMVADFFEFDGWRVVYLGANVPQTDIALALADQDADLLAISCTSTLHLRSVGELIDLVRDRNQRVAILVGGRPFTAFPNLWRTVGADGCAADAVTAVREGRRLLGE